MDISKKAMKVDDWKALLAKDEEYQAMKMKRDEHMQQFAAILAADQKPLMDSLAKAGISVNSLWDLVNTNKPYTDAIPVLVEHLQKEYHPRTKEGIARSLAVRGARKIAWDVVLAEYKQAVPDELIVEPRKRGYKDGLAVALAAMAGKEDVDALLELLKDESLRSSRIFFVKKVLRYKSNPKVIETLKKLMDDKDLMLEINRYKL
jgi:hypothetical protein